jgi:hypothetical protein
MNAVGESVLRFGIEYMWMRARPSLETKTWPTPSPPGPVGTEKTSAGYSILVPRSQYKPSKNLFCAEHGAWPNASHNDNDHWAD